MRVDPVEGFRVGFAGLCLPCCREQSFAQHRRLRSLLLAQILITGTAGQPVAFTNSRHPDNFDSKIKVAHHPADDRQLLKILFAKNSRIRRENVE